MSLQYRQKIWKLFFCCLVALMAAGARAADPPHNSVKSVECAVCHVTHNATSGGLTTSVGNSNSCLTCHVLGGTASAKAFADSDQAYPRVGSVGITPQGTSHRWDSGPGGHVEPVGTVTSTGTVQSGGVFSGRYAKRYTITISLSGAVGAAKFNWSVTMGNGAAGSGFGSGILTGANLALDEGVTLTFTNGASGTSFVAGDIWYIFVQTDLANPTDTTMSSRVENGKVLCSTCHDQHSQSHNPFDSNIPAYTGTGTGWSAGPPALGRHFQRIDNDTGQMCNQCHGARNVTSATQGSHPVNITPTVAAGTYKAPTTLPLDKTTSKIQCLTCHDTHYSPSTDGSLTRVANFNTLCTDCHLNSDTTNGAHFNATTGALWPGGQYGSTYPAVNSAKRGSCVNCHDPHGWPDDATPANDFAKLLVERADFSTTRGDAADAEDLCYTCHDGSPANDVKSDFSKTVHHPVSDTEQSAGRSVECYDCHSVHKAQAGARNYATTAGSTRNQASNPVKSASGVTVSYGTTYTAGTAAFTGASTTVTGTGTAWTAALLGQKIRRTSDMVDYTITDVASGTSLAISPAYAGTTGTGQNYLITLGNLVAPGGANYSPVVSVTYEYEICFKCHTDYAFSTYTAGTATFTNASGTVTGVGTTWNAGLVGATLQRTGDTTTYTVTAVASATSLTISPVYASATVSGQAYTIWNPPPGRTPVYNAGTATFTSGSATVTGAGTTFNAGLVGLWIRRGTETANYEITAYNSATSITISPAYSGTTGSAQAYTISGETDLAQDFSPNNKSGHPVVTGLDNYPNSIEVGSPLKRGLQTTVMLAPWNTNIGQQTMACTDCHNTDANAPAAQGPHGSAAQFMLRSWGNGAANGVGTALFTNGSATVTGTGTTWVAANVGSKISLPGSSTIYTIATWTSATSITITPVYAGTTTASVAFAMWNSPANWPNVTLANFPSSWCANCHQKGTHYGHAKSNHSSYACYRCHIVIPHGGKMSRLIADADGTMPPRYAYNNLVSNVYFTNFTKAAQGLYSENNSCRTTNGCDHHIGGPTTGENW